MKGMNFIILISTGYPKSLVVRLLKTQYIDNYFGLKLYSCYCLLLQLVNVHMQQLATNSKAQGG